MPVVSVVLAPALAAVSLAEPVGALLLAGGAALVAGALVLGGVVLGAAVLGAVVLGGAAVLFGGGDLAAVLEDGA